MEHDEQLATVFRYIRRGVGVSKEQMAERLSTTINIVEALEAGNFLSLPDWPELSGVVDAYAEQLGLDARPIRRQLERALGKRALGQEVAEKPVQTKTVTIFQPHSAQLLSKPEYLNLMRKYGMPLTGDEPGLEGYEEAARAAALLKASMPGIGFASRPRRWNCFIAVCHHLDSLMAQGEIDVVGSQLALSILRLADRKFDKAMTMFDVLAPEMGIREEAQLPLSARTYYQSSPRRFGPATA